MSKPVLVLTTHHVKEVEERIDRNYEARRNPNEAPFSRPALLVASDGADALFITPADRLDSEFFKRVSPSVKVIATYSVGFEHIDLAAAARRNPCPDVALRSHWRRRGAPARHRPLL